MTAVVSNPLPTMLKRCSGPLEAVWSFALLEEAQPATRRTTEAHARARWRIRNRAKDMDTSDVGLPSGPGPYTQRWGRVPAWFPDGGLLLRNAALADRRSVAGEQPSNREQASRSHRCLRPTSAPDREAEMSTTANILIAEDDFGFRDTLEDVLAEEGHRVSVAG